MNIIEEIEVLPPQEQIVVAVKQADLGESSAMALRASFEEFFMEADDWRKKAATITVNNASQVREMKLAREIRLALRGIRGSVEKKRKTLKEDSLRTGKAIDGVANVLKFLIEPVEKHLAEQEQFVQRQEDEQLEKRCAARELILAPLVPNIENYNLRQMSDEDFDRLMKNETAAHKARVESERKAEAERLAKEKADKQEQARMLAENKRLRVEADEREAAAQEERKAAQKLQAEERAKAQKAIDEAEAIAKTERLRVEELEAREKAQAVADRERIAAKDKAKAESAKAPDVEKLKVFYNSLLEIQVPQCSTAEGKLLTAEIELRLFNVRFYLRKEIELLTK